MTTSHRPRLRAALAVLPMAVTGLVVVPVLAVGQHTVVVGGTPDVQRLDLAAYTTPAATAPVPDAQAPDGSPADDPTTPVETVVSTPPLPTDDFRIAGVTWEPGSVDGEVFTYVRTREEGAWTPWYHLDDASDDGPDPGSAEAANARAGTDPLIVGASDAVQVKVATEDGQVPAGVQIDTLGLGKNTTKKEATPLASADAAVGMPSIKTRAAWGANEKIREQTAPDYGSVQGAAVHHTAGSNSYTKAEVPSVIRGIYAYHVQARGWRDIGYNVLVDKWGQAWEGRYGGLTRNVVGAHTLNNNSTTFGISVLGNFDTARPSAAVTETLAKVIAWKFSLNRVNPAGSRTWTTNTGKLVSKPKIVGHRDVGQTACPGAYLYAQLPSIRTRVAALMKSAGLAPTITASAAPLAYTVGGNRVDVAITVSATGRVPTGTVQVVDTERGDVLGQATLASGKASIKLPTLLAGGARRLAVAYGGDGAVAARQAAPFTVNVTKARTSTTATLSRTAVTSGDAVTATATVTGAGVVPRGTVTILSGGTVLGRGTLVKATAADTARVAVRLRGDLPGGSLRPYARYDGHVAINGSSSAASSLRVAKGAPALSAAVVGTPRWRAPSVLRVRATARGQVPTGTVVVRQGSTVVGTKALSGGTADVRLTANRNKRRTVTVSYAGSASLNAAPARSTTFSVARAKMTVKRSLSKKKVKRGQRVVLRVRATAPGYSRITGKIVVTRSGKTYRTAKLTKRFRGVRTVTIPTSARGTYKLRVELRPKGYVLPYRSKVIKLKVR